MPCFKKTLTLSFLFVIFAGCSTNEYYAPIVDGLQASAQNETHIVQPGESLYAIAWGYGVDYRELAKINHIGSPYVIKAGDALQLSSKTLSKEEIPSAPVQKLASNKKNRKKVSSSGENSHVSLSNPSKKDEQNLKIDRSWAWPAKGQLITAFGSTNNSKVSSKGIDISGLRGEAIFAARAGEVVYSGHGLLGYGNLIIIKHDDSFLSAYAHNEKNLVREGGKVSKGQQIAKMGDSGAQSVMLHFEIRRAGKPVNPTSYLGKYS